MKKLCFLQEKAKDISNKNKKKVLLSCRLFVLLHNTKLKMKSYKGGPWFVCDGCENVVVCGKKRVRYQGPCLENPFGAFESIVYRLQEMMEEDNSSALESIIKDVPQAIEVLKTGAGSA